MKRTRKITAVLLSILLICALMPTLAFAGEEMLAAPLDENTFSSLPEQTDGSSSLSDAGSDTTEATADNTQGTLLPDGLIQGELPSEQSTENALVTAGSLAALDDTSNSDNTAVEPLADGDYIDVDLSKIDGIEISPGTDLQFLDIQLRVLPETKEIIGLYVSYAEGVATVVNPLTIGGVAIRTVPIPEGSTEPLKTYRFIGDGTLSDNFKEGMKLSINGKDIVTTVDGSEVKVPIAIECGYGTTGLKLDLTDPLITQNAANSALSLNNGAHVKMTLNNDVSLASRAGYAGLNVPSDCQLDIYGSAAAVATPTLTATAGAGGAGIGGNAGHANNPIGQSSGKINLFSHLIVKATGGDAEIKEHPEGGVIEVRSGGAGIGGGGAYLIPTEIDGRGGNASLISVTGNVVLTAQGKGNSAGIGGGGGGSLDWQYGGDAEGFKAYADASGACPTIISASTGSGSGIGGGVGDEESTMPEGGKGGKIEFGSNSSGLSTPLFVTASSSLGNDLGAAPNRADKDNDRIIIRGGSVVADSFGVVPTDGTNPVYPVVIPKISDDASATTLTGHLDFEVPVSGTTTYRVRSVDGTSPEHGDTFGYAAQLWLPEGLISGIKGANSNKSVSIKDGKVNVMASMTPAFASGVNVVSFLDQESPYTASETSSSPATGDKDILPLMILSVLALITMIAALLRYRRYERS